MMLVPIEGREDAGFGIGRRPLGGGLVTAHDRMFEWDRREGAMTTSGTDSSAFLRALVIRSR